MIITTKSTYAIRFMLGLAVANGRTLSVAEVAKNENISAKFLESIVAPLKVKGLIKVKRGAHGGYLLALPLSRITLKSIIDAVEADKLLSARTDAGQSTSAQVVSSILSELDVMISNFFENKNLEEALEIFDNFKTEQMFYI